MRHLVAFTPRKKFANLLDEAIPIRGVRMFPDPTAPNPVAPEAPADSAPEPYNGPRYIDPSPDFSAGQFAQNDGAPDEPAAPTDSALEAEAASVYEPYNPTSYMGGTRAAAGVAMPDTGAGDERSGPQTDAGRAEVINSVFQAAVGIRGILAAFGAIPVSSSVNDHSGKVVEHLSNALGWLRAIDLAVNHPVPVGSLAGSTSRGTPPPAFGTDAYYEKDAAYRLPIEKRAASSSLTDAEFFASVRPA